MKNKPKMYHDASTRVNVSGWIFTRGTQACLTVPFENHQVFNIDEDRDLEFIVVNAPAWVSGDAYDSWLKKRILKIGDFL